LSVALGACSGFRVLDAGVDGGSDGGGSSGFTLDPDVAAYPGIGAMRAVWGSGAGDVHIVGDDGFIFDRPQDGADWKVTPNGPGIDLSGVWGSAPDDIYAVGTRRDTTQGIILHWLGTRWIEVGGGKAMALRAVWGGGDLRVACGLNGVIYQGQPSDPFLNGYQVGPNPNILPTVNAPILYSVSGNSPSSVMIAGDVASTYYWDGVMWHSYAEVEDPARTFRAVWAPPGPDVAVYEGANYYGIWYFTGRQNPVLKLNEERDQPQKLSRYIWGIWGPSPSQIVAVGDDGRIMLIDRDSGLNQIVPSPTANHLYGVWGSSADDVWIVGEAGTVLHGAVHF
jgi:hypothetical protein